MAGGPPKSRSGKRNPCTRELRYPKWVRSSHKSHSGGDFCSCSGHMHIEFTPASQGHNHGSHVPVFSRKFCGRLLRHKRNFEETRGAFRTRGKKRRFPQPHVMCQEGYTYAALTLASRGSFFGSHVPDFSRKTFGRLLRHQSNSEETRGEIWTRGKIPRFPQPC